jgi:hypothetical protein
MKVPKIMNLSLGLTTRFAKYERTQHKSSFKSPLLTTLLGGCLALMLAPTMVSAATGDVGVYVSPAKSYSTASYWIEGAQGLILIDTQFLPKEGLLAIELRDAAQPDTFGNRTTEINIEGISIKLHVLGQGASGAHVVAQYLDKVFVGDLINPNNHAWLELGFIPDWLARLDEIRALKPAKIYPGRGAMGGPELIDAQAAYLKQVRQWIRESLAPGDLGWLRRQLLQRKIEAAYPALGYPTFMRDGLAAVWKAEQTSR